MQASLGWRRPLSIQELRWGERGSIASAPLVDVASVKSSASLWDIGRGREFDLVVSSPRIDGSLDAEGVLRLQAAAEVGAVLFPVVSFDNAICSFRGVSPFSPSLRLQVDECSCGQCSACCAVASWCRASL